YNSKNPERGGAKKDNTGKSYQERKTDIKDLRQRWADLCNSHLEKHQIDSRIDMRSYKEQGIEKDPEKKLLPSQAKDPEIREALQQSRTAYKELERLDLGDPKNDLKDLKNSPISDKEIKQGIESFKADFASFKQLALQQYKEQQKLEREQQKTMKFRGMSR
ncbi:MobA/MobL family protein, partial [Acinetobacter baumannii]